MKRTLLTILLTLLFTGCCIKSYHSEGTDVLLISFLSKTEVRNIIVATPNKFLFVGDLSQVPDAEALQGGFGLFLDLILKAAAIGGG